MSTPLALCGRLFDDYAGMTREQLGELVGVSRQAFIAMVAYDIPKVSMKWRMMKKDLTKAQNG